MNIRRIPLKPFSISNTKETRKQCYNILKLIRYQEAEGKKGEKNKIQRRILVFIRREKLASLHVRLNAFIFDD